MHITPKSEKEIAEMGLWPVDSICSFKVIETVKFGDRNIQTADTVSKKGNDMITLVLELYNERGEVKVLVDYLLESTPGKLRNCMVSCGMLDLYNKGQFFASDFIGKTGECKVGIEKDPTGQYADKNKVLVYLTEKSNQTFVPSSEKSLTLNDEIPF